MGQPAAVVMPRPERTSDRAPDGGTDTWRGRPARAAALKACLYLGPLLAAVLVTRRVHAVWPPPGSGLDRALLWAVLLAVGFGVAVAAERWTRRYLPVTMLLRLTLVFPDQAPSRYKVMRAAAGPRALRELATSGGEASQAAAQVLALVTQLARHDKHTRGHSERVRVFADLIAEELGVVGLDRDKLRWSALLHDVGKLDVPAATLNKPGRPDDEEWRQLQGHPAAGEGRCGALYAWLGDWAGGISEHHERWDGDGCPAGLAGEGISLAGRIVAVADAYETMTAARAYKKPMATAAARRELAECAGGQFDPRVVRAFLAISLPRLLWRVGPLSFLTHLPFLGSLQLAGQSAVASAAAATAPAAVTGLSAAVVVGVLPAVSAPPAGASGVQTPATRTSQDGSTSAPSTSGDPVRPGPADVPAPGTVDLAPKGAGGAAPGAAADGPAEPVTPGPDRPAPAGPGPDAPGPDTPGPAEPRPDTPGPAEPRPDAPGPAAPAPSRPAPAEPGTTPEGPGPATPNGPAPGGPAPKAPAPKAPVPKAPAPKAPAAPPEDDDAAETVDDDGRGPPQRESERD